MRIPCYQVDAFTNVRFSGNPACVVVLTQSMPDIWMQHVAQEMNVSETAFLQKEESAYRLRWFTPTAEVDLCGHATLATAHVLFEQGEAGDLLFRTNSGTLKAEREGEWITLDFPAQKAESTVPPVALTDVIGKEMRFIGKNRFDYIVELTSEESLRELRPDWSRLSHVDSRGVIVTSASNDPRFDFVSRAFYPRIGIHEDPVTGSAHCCLGPYWGAKLGKQNLTGYQASDRGGVVQVTLVPERDRVMLRGQAVTVLSGELT